MLKINLPILEHSMHIENGTIFQIANTELYNQIILLFHNYEETTDLKIFDERQTTVKESEVVIVSDVLGFELNSSTTLKRIYSDIEDQLNLNIKLKCELETVGMTIESIIRNELLNHELDLIIDEITIPEMLKVLGLKIHSMNTSVFDKMLDIIQVFKYMYKKKLLVFINVTNYLLFDEIDELFRYILLYNIDVVFIEFGTRVFSKYVFIDEDFYIYDYR